MSIHYKYHGLGGCTSLTCCGETMGSHNHNNNNNYKCNNNRKRRVTCVSFLVQLRNASPMQISLPLLVAQSGCCNALQCANRFQCSRRYMQTYVHTMYTYVHVRVCDRTVITYSWAGNMQRNESFELPQPRRSRYVGFPSLLPL